MSFDYSESAALSLELLTEFGQDVTLTTVTVGTYAPGGTVSGGSTSTSTRKGALFSFDKGQTHVRGQLIEVSDKQLLVDAEGTVNLEDRFTVDSVEYQIVSIDEINPAGTPVLYDLHVRAS